MILITDSRPCVTESWGYLGIRGQKYIKRSCKLLVASSNSDHTEIHGGSKQTITAKAVRICRATERAWLPPGRFAYGQGAVTPAGRRGHGQGGFERLLEPAREWKDLKALAQRASQLVGGLRSALRGVDGEGRILVAARGQRGWAQEKAGCLCDRRSDRRRRGRTPQVPGVPPFAQRLVMKTRFPQNLAASQACTTGLANRAERQKAAASKDLA